jgi:hypothetical protein
LANEADVVGLGQVVIGCFPFDFVVVVVVDLLVVDVEGVVVDDFVVTGAVPYFAKKRLKINSCFHV